MTNSVLPVSAVSLSNGRPMTFSYSVAEVFEKEHKNVLRDIDDLGCSAEFRRLNFEPTFRAVPGPNGATRQERCFEITKDGFTILAMGYTGAKAMQFKEAYIQRFNEMEASLQTVHHEAPLSPQPPAAHRRQAQAQNRRAWTLTQALYPWVLERVQSGEAVPTCDELRALWWRAPSPVAGWPAGTRMLVALRPDGTFSTAPLPKGALLCTPEELPRLIADAQGGPIPATLLPAIISAAADRLGRAVAFTAGPLTPPPGK